MIVSHKYRFIFIKTRKTAGTSIEAYLSRHCGPDDIVTPLNPPVEGHRPRNYRGLVLPWQEVLWPYSNLKGRLKQTLLFRRFYNHIPAVIAKSRLPADVWDHYFKFCVERNPWDRTVSHYFMIKHRRGGNLSFEDYLGENITPPNFCHYTHPQTGELMVDRVLRYENLSDELREVFGEVGVPFGEELDRSGKADYRKERRDYQDYYTPELSELVAERSRREIELSGYRFGPGKGIGPGDGASA